MAIEIVDGAGSTKYLDASGAGTVDSPYIPSNQTDNPFVLGSLETHFWITTSGSTADYTSGSALAANTKRLTAYAPAALFVLSTTTTAGSAQGGAGMYVAPGQQVEFRVNGGDTLHASTPTAAAGGTIYCSELKS